MLLRPSARTEVRRNRYKVAVDADEGRRRRKDNMVEMYKNKREDSLQKKRHEGLRAQAMPASLPSSAADNKASAFWTCMNTAEADDPGALAAVGCLRAMSIILESVGSLPDLFIQIELTFLPIMRRMLTTDGQEVFEEVLEIVSYMTFFSLTISIEMWSLWHLMMEVLADWQSISFQFAADILVPLDNYISRGTAHFLACREPDYQQSLWNMISYIMVDRNLEDGDIEPAPKLIEVVFQNCRGQVDHWVEPYMRIAVERLRRTEESYI